MAFAQSQNFIIQNSTFNDHTGNNIQNGSSGGRVNGTGLQMLLNAASKEAAFDSQARHPSPLCDPATRKGLLEHIFHWLDSSEEEVLFLVGPAGAGKSTIAQTVAAACAKRKTLMASYFFYRDSPDRNTIELLIPTIAYQTTIFLPGKREQIEKLLKRDPSILDKSPDAQLEMLVIKPLQPTIQDRLRKFYAKQARPCLLVIDGLDECKGDGNQEYIVSLLGRLVDEGKKGYPIHCLITSRPEPHILAAVNLLATKVAWTNLSDESWDANEDIRSYLRSGFEAISRRLPPSTSRPWPSDNDIETLVRNSGGVFVYASTLLGYIRHPDFLPEIRLRHVLDHSPGTRPFAQLDQLYQEILSRCPDLTTLLHILGFAFLHNPELEGDFTLFVVEGILGLHPGGASTILRNVHSILRIGVASAPTITFLHASFGDFIFNEARSGRFFIDIYREHLFLAQRCMLLLYHREKTVLQREHKTTLDYAWKSWAYHSCETHELHTPEFSGGGRASLYAPLPEVCHGPYIDGLDSAIKWLQHDDRHQSQLVVAELGQVRHELEYSYCLKGITDQTEPPMILSVFKDPGINFFNLDQKYLALIERGGSTPPELLYFCWRGRVHNLVELSFRFPSPPITSLSPNHGYVAIHCIRLLTDRDSTNIKYAAAYWEQHLFGTRLGNIRYYSPEQVTVRLGDFTPEDSDIVRKWLEKHQKIHRYNRTKKHPIDTVNIVVMGLVGTGKTTFVNLASGSTELKVGHQLRVCTQEVQAAPSFQLDGYTVNLINTPGFDNTNMSGVEFLKTIANYLEDLYSRNVRLHGVIYLHKIDATIMRGVSLRAFALFKKICGTESLEKVLIVTTKWDWFTNHEGERHVKELTNHYFEPAISEGATMLHHDGTKRSADALLRTFLGYEEITLSLQKELMVDFKPLFNTEAGVHVENDLGELIKRARSRRRGGGEDIDPKLKQYQYDMGEIRKSRAGANSEASTEAALKPRTPTRNK